MFFEVLVEGGADVVTVKWFLENRFALLDGVDFRIHPHRGKGSLPNNPLAIPDPRHRGLLDQLPAKLRGYGRSLGPGTCVVVLVDADSENCRDLKQRLVELYNELPSRPECVLFRIAVEETESWFIAEPEAVRRAYPTARVQKLVGLDPDAVVGAWEKLAECLGKKPDECDGSDKHEWGARITPHLSLDPPLSPSLRAFIDGIQTQLALTPS
jgi:hypothetical protein